MLIFYSTDISIIVQYISIYFGLRKSVLIRLLPLTSFSSRNSKSYLSYKANTTRSGTWIRPFPPVESILEIILTVCLPNILEQFGCSDDTSSNWSQICRKFKCKILNISLNWYIVAWNTRANSTGSLKFAIWSVIDWLSNEFTDVCIEGSRLSSSRWRQWADDISETKFHFITASSLKHWSNCKIISIQLILRKLYVSKQHD